MCKINPGGCKEWETKNLRYNGGFFLEGGYTAKQCLDKCIDTHQCGMFLINKIPLKVNHNHQIITIPIGSCLLYKEGCTKRVDIREIWNYYSMESCIKGNITNVCTTENDEYHS